MRSTRSSSSCRPVSVKCPVGVVEHNNELMRKRCWRLYDETVCYGRSGAGLLITRDLSAQTMSRTKLETRRCVADPFGDTLLCYGIRNIMYYALHHPNGARELYPFFRIENLCGRRVQMTGEQQQRRRRRGGKKNLKHKITEHFEIRHACRV